MNFIIKTLVYLFFVGVVVPSSYNFIIALNENVVNGNLTFKELAAETPKHSYLPVKDFYMEQYKIYVLKEPKEVRPKAQKPQSSEK